MASGCGELIDAMEASNQALGFMVDWMEGKAQSIALTVILVALKITGAGLEIATIVVLYNSIEQMNQCLTDFCPCHVTDSLIDVVWGAPLALFICALLLRASLIFLAACPSAGCYRRRSLKASDRPFFLSSSFECSARVAYASYVPKNNKQACMFFFLCLNIISCCSD